MMLKFREDKIQRMESVLGGIVPVDSYLLEENNTLKEEIEILRAKVHKNLEVTRFAVENIRLLDQLKRYQDCCEEGEREMLLTEVSELRNQLIHSQQENHMNPYMEKEAADDKKEISLLQSELKKSREELDKCRDNLNSCLEKYAILCREILELKASLEMKKSVQDGDIEKHVDANSLLLVLGLLCQILPLLFRYGGIKESELASGGSVVEMSRASSIVMLLAYAAYLFFQLKSHSPVFEIQEEEGRNEELEEEKAVIGFCSAFVWLVAMTVIIAILSEYVVDTIQVGDATKDHACWERLEDMDTPRTVVKIDRNTPGTEVAAETAAALATASLVFRKSDRSYSKLLLNRAIRVFQFADKYRGSYSNGLKKFVCPYYCSYSGYEGIAKRSFSTFHFHT